MMATMTLSEAIRLGAMNRPQGFHRYLTGPTGDERTCALAAALEASGTPIKEFYSIYGVSPTDEVSRRFPILNVTTACPECGMTEMPSASGRMTTRLQHIVVHLNDYHMWTRERNADFVETIERLAAEQEQANVVVAAQV